MTGGNSEYSPNCRVRGLYGLQKRLNYLHDTCGLSWRKIAATGEFSAVSHATLQAIANGRTPGRAVRQRLGVRVSNKRRLAFWLTDADFERAIKTIDTHPGGRVGWLLEHIENGK